MTKSLSLVAGAIGTYVRAVPTSTQLVLIGHSKGGMACLQYVATEGRRLPANVRGVFTVATPVLLEAKHFPRPPLDAAQAFLERDAAELVLAATPRLPIPCYMTRCVRDNIVQSPGEWVFQPPPTWAATVAPPVLDDHAHILGHEQTVAHLRAFLADVLPI